MRFVALLLLPFFALAPVAAAQTVEFAATVSRPGRASLAGGEPSGSGRAGFSVAANGRLEVAFADVPVAGGSAGLRLAAGQQLELGVRLRRASSLETIGNLVTTLAAEGSTGGRYSSALSARAVLGPAAVRARLFASDGLEPLAPLGEGSLRPLPLLGPGPVLLGFDLGASYRASRSIIVDVAPSLYLRDGLLGGRLDGELRLVRAFGNDDLSLAIETFARPGFGAGSAALGAGYALNRRRAPTWQGWLLLGTANGALAPGLRLGGGERFPGGRIDLDVAIEPYRLSARPYRGSLTYEREVGPGDLRVVGSGALDPGGPASALLRVGYRLPFRR